MNVLLEFSASSTQPSSNGRCTDDSANIREDSASLIESNDCVSNIVILLLLDFVVFT